MRIFILEHGPTVIATVLGGLAGGFAMLACMLSGRLRRRDEG
jgi:hypothetical protein